MKTLRRNEGSTLIMLIGVVAALAIMSASVVVLVTNVQSNTSRDRAQTRSFTVAEGGVDLVMAGLNIDFPKSSTATIPVDVTGFLSGLDAAEYGDAQLAWQLYDDTGTDASGGMDYSVGTQNYDSNDNNRIWIEVTGTVNGRSTRIRALAEMVLQNLGLVDNIAIWTIGEFNNQSSASTVSYEVLGPGATLATVQYNYLDAGSRALDGTLIQEVTPAMPADKVMTPELLSYFKGYSKKKDAVGVGKFFTDVSQIAAYATGPKDQKPWEGVVYVDSGTTPTQLSTTQNITWSWNDNPPIEINGDGVGSHKQPGVIIADAKLLKIQGNNSQYYGLIYCSGAVELTGGMTVHGIVLAGGQGLAPGEDAVKLNGNQTVIYNDNVRANLNREFSVSIRIVPGSWRELLPSE